MTEQAVIEKSTAPAIIGALEWVALPELGVRRIRARVDTGAASSALHVENIHRFRRKGRSFVRFQVVIGIARNWRRLQCEAPLAGTRLVRNTSGKSQMRPVIRTALVVGGSTQSIEITLSNRERMRYRMLLGRSGIPLGWLVNPARVYLQRQPQTSKAAEAE